MSDKNANDHVECVLNICRAQGLYGSQASVGKPTRFMNSQASSSMPPEQP